MKSRKGLIAGALPLCVVLANAIGDARNIPPPDSCSPSPSPNDILTVRSGMLA